MNIETRSALAQNTSIQWNYPCRPPCSTLQTHCRSTGLLGFWTECQKTVTYYDAATLVNHQEVEQNSSFILAERISNWFEGVKKVFTPYSVKQSSLNFMKGVAVGTTVQLALLSMVMIFSPTAEKIFSSQSCEQILEGLVSANPALNILIESIKRNDPHASPEKIVLEVLKDIMFIGSVSGFLEELGVRVLFYNVGLTFLQKGLLGLKDSDYRGAIGLLRGLLSSYLFARLHKLTNYKQTFAYLLSGSLMLAYYHLWGYWGAAGAHVATNFIITARSLTWLQIHRSFQFLEKLKYF